MKSLVDDALSTRPLSIVFYLLANSGQVQGHHLSRERTAKIIASTVYLFLSFGWGLWTGWIIWGGR